MWDSNLGPSGPVPLHQCATIKNRCISQTILQSLVGVTNKDWWCLLDMMCKYRSMRDGSDLCRWGWFDSILQHQSLWTSITFTTHLCVCVWCGSSSAKPLLHLFLRRDDTFSHILRPLGAISCWSMWAQLCSERPMHARNLILGRDCWCNVLSFRIEAHPYWGELCLVFCTIFHGCIATWTFYSAWFVLF